MSRVTDERESGRTEEMKMIQTKRVKESEREREKGGEQGAKTQFKEAIRKS